MRSHDEDTTRPSAQAFTPEYLELLDQRDEPATGAEAETAGPWSFAPHPRGYAVLRAGESLDLGDRPAAWPDCSTAPEVSRSATPAASPRFAPAAGDA